MYTSVPTRQHSETNSGISIFLGEFTFYIWNHKERETPGSRRAIFGSMSWGFENFRAWFYDVCDVNPSVRICHFVL